ncbi:MAG: hypothetical protein EBZ74_00235 [Planctomycetia bacterium]|nr:hypothetical protein [Planctomycetia bacterium]
MPGRVAPAREALREQCRGAFLGRQRGVPSPEEAGKRAVHNSTYAAWAGDVAALCRAVAALQPLAGPLGAADPAGCAWHGQLFGKLAGQVAREPVLVAAVCGGTNVGKSLIANTLVGSSLSRSVPEAARTLHPVASLPAGRAARIDVAALFPGFTPVAWRSDADALEAPDSDRLVWREDPTGRQPERLVLLDTPDIDGTLRENWHRAGLVRDACDVLIAVLTQQKYNDAAVRDFFRAAAAARKGVIVVFNMVDWPRQRERLGGCSPPRRGPSRWPSTPARTTPRGPRPAGSTFTPFPSSARPGPPRGRGSRGRSIWPPSSPGPTSTASSARRCGGRSRSCSTTGTAPAPGSTTSRRAHGRGGGPASCSRKRPGCGSSCRRRRGRSCGTRSGRGSSRGGAGSTSR